MKILAIEKECGNINVSAEILSLEEEARAVHHLYLSGVLREIYFNEFHRAVILLECENTEKATELLNALPLVKKGMIDFEIMQLLPYTGYERILK